MTRAFDSGFLGLLGVALVVILPVACQSGGVGDPCIPEEEFDPTFAGFKVTEENIESRSFQCQTRICLVNHFQGRVSCPLGQPAPVSCAGPDDTSCPNGQRCVPSAGFDCAEGQSFQAYVCHADSPDACQREGAGVAENEGKACCVPGTDVPVGAPVCGQCADGSNRNAEQAVYCSCRCGVAEGEEEDPDFNFCECPDGFSCSEIRKDFELGDKQLTGKYCIKE